MFPFLLAFAYALIKIGNVNIRGRRVMHVSALFFIFNNPSLVTQVDFVLFPNASSWALWNDDIP